MKYGLITLMAVLLSACGPAQDEQGTQTRQDTDPQQPAISIDTTEIKHIITQRCSTCHSKEPTDDVFRVAPSNVMFDTLDQMQRSAARIHARSVATQTMPFMNKTGMTEEERSLLGEWVKAGAPIN